MNNIHTPSFMHPLPITRRVQRDFDITTAFDRHTVFRISYLPFVFFDVIWDYIDSLMDMTCFLRIHETKKLNRAMREIRADYDYFRSKHLDFDHREKTREQSEQFVDESEPLKWAWRVILSEVKKKNPDMDKDWVMFVAQCEITCSLFAALRKYANHFDKMITEKAGRKMHSILPDEFNRMHILIPHYMGDIPHTRIRRVVDHILFKDFLEQPLSDEKEE